MAETDFNVDFHCHATLRAMNSLPSGNVRNLWEKTYNAEFNTPFGRWAKTNTSDIAKESQTNLYDYAASNTRVIFDSLYPVEKGWQKFRRVPAMLVGKKTKEILMHVAFGIECDRMYELIGSDRYFHELEESYQFLISGQGTSPDGKKSYRVAKSAKDLSDIINSDANTIAVVITIEGAHALECGAPFTSNYSPGTHKELLAKNISTIKNWEYPVFFINLAHHFYNELCGHTRSLKSPVSLIFKQDLGINKGITDLGWFVINRLLDRKDGRRILIDTKHMSLQSRMEYYAFLSEYNRANPSNKIPAICSHGAVSGFATMKEAGARPDVMRKMKGNYFNSWSINLSDEEINMIHDTGGMIGLMMDKTILGSPSTLNKIKSNPDPQQRKNLMLKLYLDNIFHVVKAIGKKSAWDCIVCGTDYDGIIMHLDTYSNAATLGNFREDLKHFTEEKNYHSELWYGYTPEVIFSKIFRDNSLNFLKKYFKA